MSDENQDHALPPIPEGWSWRRVDDLAARVDRAITDGPFGSNLKTAHYTEAGPRVIRLQNIGDGEFLDAEAHISQSHFERLRAHEATAGDVVVASLGETLPRACLVPDDLGPAVVKADCPRIRVGDEVRAKFLCAALNSPPVREQAAALIAGIGRPRLNLRKLKQLRIPTPPLAEQDRIIEAIESAFERIGEGLANLERAELAADEFGDAIVEAALRPALSGHMPSGWRSLTPPELAKDTPHALAIGPFGSNLKVSDYRDCGVPLVFVRNIRSERFDGPDTRYVHPDKAQELSAHQIEPGDLLVTKMGDPPGDCCVYPATHPRAVITADCIRFVVDSDNADPGFVALLFRSRHVRSQINARTKGVAQRKISLRTFKTVEFPLPSVSKQRDLRIQIEAHLRERDQLVEGLAQIRVHAQALRRAVLSEAFSGALNSHPPSGGPLPS